MLTRYHQSLQRYTEHHSGRDRLTMMAVMDWIGHLASLPFLLPEYSYSLVKYLRETIVTDRLGTHWGYKVLTTPTSSGSLVYRHYLTERAIATSLVPGYPYQPLLHLMAASLVPSVAFASSPEHAAWPELDGPGPLINRLHLQQVSLQANLRELADRADITDTATRTGHALLSSYQLVYAIYLVAVLLAYESAQQQTSPNYPQELYRETIALLADLKGVLFTWRSSKARH